MYSWITVHTGNQIV